MRGKSVFYAVLLAIGLLLVTSPVLADDGDPPGLIVGEDFTLHDGERVEGDLVIVDGDVFLMDGSRVEGNVVVWDGMVRIAGEVEGDVTTFGGDVELEETAEVEGDISTFGGELEQEAGARIGGQHIVGPGGSFGGWPVPVPVMPRGPFRGGVLSSAGNLFLSALRTVLLALVMGVLGGLAMLLWPASTLRVGRTAVVSLMPSLGVGLLTMIVSIVVGLGLVITICFSLLGGLVMLAVAVVTAYGWIGLGVYLGERLFTSPSEPFWRALLGVGLLTLLGSVMEVVPCIGWILPFLAACVGLGSVILTRFGTQPYPPGFQGEEPPPPAVPPSPQVPPAPPAVVAAPEAESPPPASRVRVFPAEAEAPPPEVEESPPPPPVPPASPEVGLPPEEG